MNVKVSVLCFFGGIADTAEEAQGFSLIFLPVCHASDAFLIFLHSLCEIPKI